MCFDFFHVILNGTIEFGHVDFGKVVEIIISVYNEYNNGAGLK